MNRIFFVSLLYLIAGTSTISFSGEHPGREYIEKNGYKGPATYEECHAGTAKQFLRTVHWKHASKVTNVDGLDPNMEYGMKNRIYTMCNGNDIVNNLKEIPKSSETGKSKFSGCNTCHPGNHLSDVGSTGADAENAVDCLVCHSGEYDFRQSDFHSDINPLDTLGLCKRASTRHAQRCRSPGFSRSERQECRRHSGFFRG